MKPWDVGRLTPEQYRMLVENLPEIAYRENLQTASLMAAVLNRMGGKPDPNDKETKLVPADRLYQPEEMLVYFAQRPVVSRWTPESAKAAVEAKPSLPAWARDAIPWADVEPLARPEASARATDLGPR